MGTTFTQSEDFSSLIGPPNDDVIWRYMNLGGLTNLLLRQQLYFTRTDMFNDLFEGVPPSSADPATRYTDLQREAFVTCWNLSEHESYALWAAYSNLYEGVAICSTRKRLFESTSAGTTAMPVLYLDGDNDKIEVYAPQYHFFQKDKQWSDEKEFRALIFDPSENEINRFGYTCTRDRQGVITGIYATVNPVVLMDKIVVSPLAKPWFIETIELLVTGCRYGIPVQRSSLSGRVR